MENSPYYYNLPKLEDIKNFYCIWFDRSVIINPYDTEQTEENIWNLTSQMLSVHKNVTSDERISTSESDVPRMMERYSKRLFYAKLIIIGVTLPVIILGLYLTILGNNLGEKDLLKEISFFKTRGVSGYQIKMMLILQSAVLGLVASILGLLLGIQISNLFLSSDSMMNAIFFTSKSPVGSTSNFEQVIPNSTIYFIIICSTIMMILITLRSIKRIINTPLSEGLRLHYNDASYHEKYLFKVDIVLLSISLIAFSSIMWIDPQNPPQLLGTFGIYTFMLLYTISIALSPLLPFFLGISVTRILTRKTKRPYSFASILTRPISRNLWAVVKKNMTRNRKRASGMCILIALSLCFGLYILAIVESEYDQQMRNSEIASPADIIATSYIGPELVDNITSIEGVSGCSPVTFIGGDRGSYKVDDRGNIFFLDPDYFLNNTSHDNSFLGRDKRRDVFSKLKTPDSVITWHYQKIQ